MFKLDTPEYITLHTISCYSIIFEPYQSSQTYMLRKQSNAWQTHLSIETTYIAYPICYTMMLPNMPFRKADAHPLRLNTRCKDLTLVPSRDEFAALLLGWDCHKMLRLTTAQKNGPRYQLYPLVSKHSYWTWPFIVDLPIKNGDFP